MRFILFIAVIYLTRTDPDANVSALIRLGISCSQIAIYVSELRRYWRERILTLKLLNKVTNLIVIAGTLVFLAIVVRNQLWKPTPQPHPPAADAAALRGKNLQIPGLAFPRARASVLLVISTKCHFFEESLPFYRALSLSSGLRATLLRAEASYGLTHRFVSLIPCVVQDDPEPPGGNHVIS